MNNQSGRDTSAQDLDTDVEFETDGEVIMHDVDDEVDNELRMTQLEGRVKIDGNNVTLPSLEVLMQACGTKSSAIRFLHQHKIPTSVIASHLKIKYQHARAVIMSKPKKASTINGSKYHIIVQA